MLTANIEITISKQLYKMFSLDSHQELGSMLNKFMELVNSEIDLLDHPPDDGDEDYITLSAGAYFDDEEADES